MPYPEKIVKEAGLWKEWALMLEQDRERLTRVIWLIRDRAIKKEQWDIAMFIDDFLAQYKDN